MNKKLFIGGGIAAVLLFFWLALGTESSESTALMVTPQKGPFQVEVTTTGELRAQNSTRIMGPQGAREIRVYNIKIQKLVPEGTIVEKGDFVAELDRSEIMGKMQDAQLEVQKVQSQFEQAQLDSMLTLSEARNNLINLEYTLEEREIAVEQSKYESPAVQRQAEIDYEKAQRQFKQEKKNYQTKVKQAEAKLREIEADLQKKKNELNKIRDIMKDFSVEAPENGMVIYKRNWNGSKVTEGSSISSWSPVVAELPDFSVMESVTYVNEVDIQKIKKGQEVEIGLDANPDKSLTGVVTSVANIGEQRPNSDSKVFEVVIEVNEADTTLRPAMTTSNKIRVNQIDEALYVPLEVIHSRDSLSYVFKKDGLKTVKQQVLLGLMNENEVVIEAGLTMNDQVYLSTPADTSGMEFSNLPDDVVREHMEKQGQQSNPPETEPVEEPEKPRKLSGSAGTTIP